MKLSETALRGCFVVEIEPSADDRGYFARTFCAREFAAHGLNPAVAQSSISMNLVPGTLRGLHFQSHPFMEDKLVRCCSGAMFDVAVDLRVGSETFGCWIGEELSAENNRQLFIPKGCAHGFQTLLPNTLVAYQIAQFFEADRSAGIRWDDPDVGVAWPLAPAAQSPRDLTLPRLRDLDPAMLMPSGLAP